MKRIVLSGLLMTAIAGMFQPVMAQTVPQPAPDPAGNIKNNLSAVRFAVNTPSSIAGLKTAAIASFGVQPTNASLYSNKQVVLGMDTLGASTLTNPTALAGKFALLYRGGGINFIDKAARAQAAGAIGLIIVNNVSGDPFAPGVAAGSTTTVAIPVIMISNVDGNAIDVALHNNITVTASLGVWNLGVAHDLGFIRGYQALPAALNIPLSQFSKSNNVPAYRNYLGGAIANFGTATETGIVVNDTVMFTPTTGGSTTVVNANSYTVPSISPTDSVRFGFGTAASSFYLTPGNTTGRYDYHYGLTFGNTDAIPADNFYNYSQYITDSIFCKGAYDYVNNQPYYSNLAIRFPNGGAFSMGPLFYITNDGYAARKMQYLPGSETSTLDGADVTVLLMKWVDGSGSTPVDSIIEGDELKLVGFTDRSFDATDSSFKFYSSNIINANPDSLNKVVVLDGNSWYWAAAQSDGATFLGVDKSQSYFTRGYAAKHLSKFVEYPEGLFGDIASGFLANSSDSIATYPFSDGTPYFVDSIHYDNYNETPAMALHISKNPVQRGSNVSSTGVGTLPASIGHVAVFPNPASSDMTISVNLDRQSAKVGYRLFDVAGRTVYSEDHVNVQKESFTVNISTVASGTYYLLVRTDYGPSMHKVVIKK